MGIDVQMPCVFETCSVVCCFKLTHEMQVVEIIVRPPYGFLVCGRTVAGAEHGAPLRASALAHCNCNHTLFQNQCYDLLNITILSKRSVAAVEVVTVCWSYDFDPEDNGEQWDGADQTGGFQPPGVNR